MEALAVELRATQAVPALPVRGERTTSETPSVEDPATGRPWRPYPQLITPEPEPGEELVNGEATPTIVAWRRARKEYREASRRLDELDAERRLWELEIVLIRDHELTLPPASYPWDQFDRRDEVWGLERALAGRAAAVATARAHPRPQMELATGRPPAVIWRPCQKGRSVWPRPAWRPFRNEPRDSQA